MRNYPRVLNSILQLSCLLTLFAVFGLGACSSSDDSGNGNGGSLGENSGFADASVGSDASSYWGEGSGGGMAASAGSGGMGGATGGTGGSAMSSPEVSVSDGGVAEPSVNVADGGLPADEDSGAVEPACITDQETVLYLSADDSNSMASPVIVRKAIREGQEVYGGYIRTYEFTNYYDFKYTAPERGALNIVPQIRRDTSAGDGEYAMQIGIQSHTETLAQARPMVLTFVVDSSGSMSGMPLDLEKASLKAIA